MTNKSVNQLRAGLDRYQSNGYVESNSFNDPNDDDIPEHHHSAMSNPIHLTIRMMMLWNIWACCSWKINPLR